MYILGVRFFLARHHLHSIFSSTEKSHASLQMTSRVVDREKGPIFCSVIYGRGKTKKYEINGEQGKTRRNKREKEGTELISGTRSKKRQRKKSESFLSTFLQLLFIASSFFLQCLSRNKNQNGFESYSSKYFTL